MPSYKAISGVDDASQTRVALVQGHEIVHAPMSGLPIQPLDADLTSWALITRAAGFDTFVTTPSSANLAALVTNETGTGLLVFGTSPTIDTPRLTLEQSANPGPVTEGIIQWDTDDDAIAVGNGASTTKFFPKLTFASVATTSGTSVDFTGIPSWATRIALSFNQVSTTGTSAVIIQLGDSGGAENAGYVGGIGVTTAAAAVTVIVTTGFQLVSAAAASLRSGTLMLNLQSAATFTWAAFGVTFDNNGTASGMTSGVKATSAALDRVRLTTVGGADTFDGGSMNISWE